MRVQVGACRWAEPDRCRDGGYPAQDREHFAHEAAENGNDGGDDHHPGNRNVDPEHVQTVHRLEYYRAARSGVRFSLAPASCTSSTTSRTSRRARPPGAAFNPAGTIAVVKPSFTASLSRSSG